MSVYDTIHQLASRWAGANRPVLRHVFPLLAEGQPVPVERIAENAGVSAGSVEDALVHGRVGRDSMGRVVELSGLMLSPSMHRVDVGGLELFSCCALLAHMTPLPLGRAVGLESVDPQSRGLLRCNLDPFQGVSFTPKTAMGSFMETDEGALAIDVSANFCSHVHHFVDLQSAQAFVNADPGRYVVEISQLRAAAEEPNRTAWS